MTVANLVIVPADRQLTQLYILLRARLAERAVQDDVATNADFRPDNPVIRLVVVDRSQPVADS